MRVETSTFEASHGKAPRGLGNWAFEFVKFNCHPLTFHYMGTYSAAKAAAVKEARLDGADFVKVLP